jgi:hypothetical protein
VCKLYVPNSAAILPPLLEWTACDSSAPDSGIDCRRLDKKDYSALPPFVDAAWASNDGRVLISGYRGAEPPLPGKYWFVAEADGPIRNAVYEADPFTCSLEFGSLFGGYFAVRVFTGGPTNTNGSFFAGEVASLPARLVIPVADGMEVPFPTAFGPIDLLAGYQVTQYRWDDGGLDGTLWTPAQDNGLQQGPFAPSTDATFWSANNLDINKVNVYTRDAGVQAFLSAGLAVDHGYADLGTDGHDLAWIEASGRQTGGLTAFATYDIMTAAYTTEPTAVQPRRLRSESGPTFGGNNFVVGCGYAARSNGSNTRLVRLSDGASWLMSQGKNVFGQPLAVTCTQVFLTLAVGTASLSSTTLARVRIDSLGSPITPD